MDKLRRRLSSAGKTHLNRSTEDVLSELDEIDGEAQSGERMLSWCMASRQWGVRVLFCGLMVSRQWGGGGEEGALGGGLYRDSHRVSDVYETGLPPVSYSWLTSGLTHVHAKYIMTHVLGVV